MTPNPIIPDQSPTARLTSYRDARIDAVRRGRILGGVSVARALFVHLLPLGGLEDVVAMAPEFNKLRTLLPPIGAASWDHRFNADGFLVHAGNWRSHEIVSYVQWLRCGGVEICSGDLVSDPNDHSPFREPTLHTHALATYLHCEMPKAVNALRELLGVARPLALSASLLGMKGVRFPGLNHYYSDGYPIDRDVVCAPWMTIEPASNPSHAVTATGDVLWQSAGWEAMPPVPSP